MFNPLKRTGVWYCYALTLAVALGSISAAALYDFIQQDATPLGRLPMRASGCLLGIMLCGAIISLLQKKRGLTTVFAGGALLLAVLFFFTWFVNADPLENIDAANPLLLLAVSLIATSTLSALSSGPKGRNSLLSSLIVTGLGILSLLSHWYMGLGMFTLGSGPEANVLVSLLLILSGILLPYLHALYLSDFSDYFSGLLLLSLLGVGAATFSWHSLRIEQSQNLIERAEVLATDIRHSYNQNYQSRIQLISRLAERWAVLKGNDLEYFWQQDARSYLRDFPEIAFLALLEPDLQPRFVALRDSDSQFTPSNLLSNWTTHRWLKETLSTGSQRISPPFFNPFGYYHSAIAIPLDSSSTPSLSVLAVFDFQMLFDQTRVSHEHSLDFRLSFENSVVFDTSPNTPSGKELTLISQPVAGGSWSIEVYTRGNVVTPGELYFPPTSLFTGLAVSLLLLLSYLFYRQSEERAEGLADLNEKLSHHLESERALRFTNDRIMQFSRDILCSISADGAFKTASPASESVLGYTPNELIDKKYTELLVPEDIEATERKFRQLIAGEISVSRGFHTRFRHKDGQTVTVSWTAEWSKADQTLFCVGRDMTEQRQFEERLIESEALLQMSERAALLGGWTFDLATRKLTLSNGTREIFGIKSAHTPEVEAFTANLSDKDLERLQRVAGTCSRLGIGFDEQFPTRTFEQQPIWVRVIGRPVTGDDSTITKLQGACQDITESHEALEQVRMMADRHATIFESITDAVFTLDQQWRFTYVNSKSEDLLHTSRDQLLGRSIWETFPDAVGGHFFKNYHLAMETGESVSFEGYYAPLDNWVEVSAYPSEEGLTVYYRRINDRKEAEQRLAAAMAELERSNRELEDFAFVASHDLQEPLRKIQTFSDRLLTKSDQFESREQDYLQRMQSAAERMQRLIEDLLLYSRVSTRGQPMSVCDASAILEEVLQDLETAISREKATIEVEELPQITGDATQLRQVFQNLLSNAIKFHAPDKTPSIKVYAEDVNTAGWTLVVEDNGIGFDIRYADKLFHPFQRLHGKASYSGTGIGMAIVKKILDRHGADISVTSEPGQGTNFRIRFGQPSTEGILVDA